MPTFIWKPLFNDFLEVSAVSEGLPTFPTYLAGNSKKKLLCGWCWLACAPAWGQNPCVSGVNAGTIALRRGARWRNIFIDAPVILPPDPTTSDAGMTGGARRTTAEAQHVFSEASHMRSFIFIRVLPWDRGYIFWGLKRSRSIEPLQ